MKKIGLTGGIASGKSTVAEMLQTAGIPVIDADELSREVVQPGSPCLNRIIAEFGNDILNNDETLNRKALAGIIFGDQERRKTLESILHPAIASLASEKLHELEDSGKPVAVYMAPLLIEAGIYKNMDEIWVVYVNKKTQLKRLVSRDNLSIAEAEMRLSSQMPMEEKIKYGKIIIDNNGDIAGLKQQIEEICRNYLQMPLK
ncbi:MAG: dephospho-CoA kinase [Desulfuromonadales bacterium]|nr:dephospho-CoA kinase [Desulfuromonadales bacterium]